MRENHRFLVIQDVERAEPVRELEPPFAGTVFSDNGTIRPCTGCFGCWIKTPGRCVLPDPYRDMGAYLANSGELVLVSRCCFGGPGRLSKMCWTGAFRMSIPILSSKTGRCTTASGTIIRTV